MRDVTTFIALMLMAGLGFEIGRYVTVRQVRNAIKIMMGNMTNTQEGDKHDAEDIHADSEGK